MRVIITGSVTEPLSDEEFGRVVDKLGRFGITEVEMDDSSTDEIKFIGDTDEHLYDDEFGILVDTLGQVGVTEVEVEYLS